MWLSMFIYVCVAVYIPPIACLRDWLVLPTPEYISGGRASAVHRDLRQILGRSAPIKPIEIPSKGVAFWKIQASDTQVKMVRKIQNVDRVVPDEELFDMLEKVEDNPQQIRPANVSSYMTGSTLRELKAPIDLKLVSWPDKLSLSTLQDMGKAPFAYEADFKANVNVYIIDEGVDISNTEFSDVRTRWLYTSTVEQTPTDLSTRGHGTCVASKAVGKSNGISKHSSLVVVKTKRSLSGIFEAFIKILQDLPRKPTPSVVICTFGQHEPFPYDSWRDPPDAWPLMRDVLAELGEAGVIVVTAAGNLASRSPYVDSYPTLFAEDPALPVLAVGGIDQRGSKTPNSQYLKTRPTFWAPGLKVTCTKRGPPGESIVGDGTSLAAPLVGGLIAYFLGLPTVPWSTSGQPRDQVKLAYDFLNEKATRKFSGPNVGDKKVIWNLQEFTLKTDITNMTEVSANNSIKSSPRLLPGGFNATY